MGVVMYQMLVGRPPFEAESYAELVLKVNGDPPSPLRINLPPGLEQIVMRCLEKDPRNRFQTVGELARMIAPYASDPMSAAQSAERASRILARDSRGNNLSLSSLHMGSGSIAPPAFTPKSWHHTGGSSVGGAAGQIGTSQGTRMVRGGRGLVIGVVATLVVVAGAVGFGLSSSMNKRDNHVGAPNPLERTMSTDKLDNGPSQIVVEHAPETQPDIARPDPKPEAKPIEKPDAVRAVTADPTKPVVATDVTDVKDVKDVSDVRTTIPTVNAATAKPAASKSPAKTASAKSTATTKSSAKLTTAKKRPKDDGLFDDRH
ncbi:hypothetical protein BH11MYX1_BH11MYX1_30240 [soil metagenome]